MDTSYLTDDTPKSVLKIPVEIWREIIDQLLWDPVRFGVDPFYPGCNPHTALDQWFDERPLRTLEIQRGHLRLVSRSWKSLAESSRWQYFKTNLPLQTQRPEPQLYSASRLKLRDYCSACGLNWSGAYHRCPSCRLFTDNIALESILQQGADYRPTRAEILTFPFWESHAAASSSHERTLRYFQPSLRALVIRTTLSLGIDVCKLLSNLTFLSIEVRVRGGDSNPPPPSSALFPAMKTFRLVAKYEADCSFLEHWETPILARFEVITELTAEQNRLFFMFIEKFGQNLIGLRLSFQSCNVLLPENIWQVAPRLKYLGVGKLHHSGDPLVPTFPPLPGEHPLHTFAILDSNRYRSLARLDIIHLISQWRGITTIADSHTWDTSIEAFEDECHSEVVLNSFVSGYYCACLGRLYAICVDRGIRYEDRMGKSYAEYLTEESLSVNNHDSISK